MYETTEWADRILTDDPLPREEEQRLFRIIQNDLPGKQEAIDKLVRHNLRFLMHMARKWSVGFHDTDDVFQEGARGLIHAAKMAKPAEMLDGKTVPFVGYAEYWIRSYIQRYATRMRRAVRLPSHLHKDFAAFAKWYERYMQEHESEPHFDDFEEAFGDRDTKYVGYAMGVYRQQHKSLNEPISGDRHMKNSPDWINVIYGDDNPEEKTLDNSRKDLVESIIAEYVDYGRNMPWSREKRNVEIVRDRFGLNGRTPMTIYELGERHGISPQAVSEITSKFLGVVRNNNRFKDLREEAWNNISS